MTASVLPSAAENELYQELVVEHKRAPRHFGTLAAPTHSARGHNQIGRASTTYRSN